MDKIAGNYLAQANKDFPMDCETLDALQTNAKITEILGNIADDKVILFGCSGTITNLSDGYVFLRTQDNPQGEILHFEGGNVSSGVFLKKTDVPVSAQGNTYPKAYTARSLAAGMGSEQYQWSDFKVLSTIKELQDEIAQLQKDLAALALEPFGIVKMWAGAKVPDNYALCDGSVLKISDYPDLYASLGITFNTALDSNGNQYTTQAGDFRLPDLQGRFVVGYSGSDADYNVFGKAGGEKKHTLTSDELPTTNITMKDYCQIPNGGGEITTGTITVAGKQCPAGGDSISGIGKRAQTDSTKNVIQWIQHDAGSFGGDKSHENRPPYYALAYIMKVK